MIRMLSIACALAILVAVPASAADQTEKVMSPKSDFTLSQPLVVGATTLAPGQYAFQCKMIGDKEYLVVTGEDGKEVARVPCVPEELTAKVQTSDFRYAKRPDGVAELTAVRIRGEKVAHRVVSD